MWGNKVHDTPETHERLKQYIYITFKWGLLYHLAKIQLEHLWDGLLLLRLIDFQLLNLKWEFVFLIAKLKDEASNSLGAVQRIARIALQTLASY